MSDHLPATPAHALCVYAEPLAAGRRVVVIGDASSGLGERLLDLGARFVHVYDPSAERADGRAAEAPRGLSIRALPHGEFDVRDGAFELAIVPDLAGVDDPAALLARLRRLVGNEGAVLVAATNPESPAARTAGGTLEYTDLYDLVALQFASVRMIGQVPFSGVAIAELGEAEGEPRVTVDTQLVSTTPAPELFIALGSQRDVRLEAYAIVQLPAGSGIELPETSTSEHVALAEAQLRANLLATQLEDQRRAALRLASDGDRGKRVEELERTLEERSAKLKESEARAGDHYVRAERLTHDLRRLEEELQRHRDRATRLTKELEDEKRIRTRAEVELGMVRKSPDLANARDRVGALEQSVHAAEQSSLATQRRLVEAERLIATREQQIVALAAELEAFRAAVEQAPAIDPNDVARLAARLERTEAELVAAHAELAHVGEAHGGELAGVEALLRERARAIQALEREVARREQIVHELLASLEDAHERGPAAANAPHDAAVTGGTSAASSAELEAARHEVRTLRGKLDALAGEVARREGDLRTTEWRVIELEQELDQAKRAAAEAEMPPATTTPSASDATQLRAELDALRQALAQEHEARIRAESGEELTLARAELARQATLVEQLSRELAARAGGGEPTDRAS